MVADLMPLRSAEHDLESYRRKSDLRGIHSALGVVSSMLFARAMRDDRLIHNTAILDEAMRKVGELMRAIKAESEQ